MDQITSVEKTIREKLNQFSPEFVEVENESHMHRVAPGSESHFKVTVGVIAGQAEFPLFFGHWTFEVGHLRCW